jgi:hypothetical protein
MILIAVAIYVISLLVPEFHQSLSLLIKTIVFIVTVPFVIVYAMIEAL